LDTNAIETRGLTKAFGDVTAVSGLDLVVRRGEIFGLIGPDGAGKTTTMRILSGIMRPDGGEAVVLGRDVVANPESVKEHIGYMSQRFGLYEDLTVAENIEFYADLYLVPKRKRTPRFERLMEFSRLSPFLDRLAGNLSGGMKQKLGLACALIHTPELLLLDEPTNGVDPVSRREFWKMLYELLKEGVTIFISTPYMDEADRCHRVGIMDQSALIVSDTPESIRKELKTRIVEIRAEDGRGVRDFCKTLPWVENVIFFGDRLHISIKKEQFDIKKVEKLLVEKKFGLIAIREITPSLEDVFFEFSEVV
jgi:ABC-2 type transport system ATP-binding protein